MTDLPELGLDGRGQRRVDITNQILQVISDQAEYIEQLELAIDELVDFEPPADEPDPEPEDPRYQNLRELGVSEEEIERLKAADAGDDLLAPDELDGPGLDADQGMDITTSLASMVASHAPQLVLTKPAEPEVAEAQPPARRRPKKVNPPRAGRPAPGHRIEIVDNADDNPFANGQIPGVDMVSPAVLNQPRKTTPPRKRSTHQIPEHLQQWKKDGAGRRVPIDTPEDS